MSSKKINIDDLPKKAKRLIGLYEKEETKGSSALNVIKKMSEDGKTAGVKMQVGKLNSANKELEDLDDEIGDEIAVYLEGKVSAKSAVEEEKRVAKEEEEPTVVVKKPEVKPKKRGLASLFFD